MSPGPMRSQRKNMLRRLDFCQGKKWCAVQPETAEEMSARRLCRGDKAWVSSTYRTLPADE